MVILKFGQQIGAELIQKVTFRASFFQNLISLDIYVPRIFNFNNVPKVEVGMHQGLHPAPGENLQHVLLADLGEARGCSTNTFVIH